MAFTPEEPKTPASIGDISIVLTDYVGMDEDGIPLVDTADYEVQVLQADGSMFKVLSGNLVPHLTAGQISALQAFMSDMRAKAVAEILGE